MKSSILIASCLLLAAPAFAQTAGSGTDNRPSGQQAGSPAGGAGSPSSGTASPDDEVLCRRIAADTGSRISGRQRVCMTRRQWREHERRN